MSNEATINYMLKYLEDKYGPKVFSKEDARCELKALRQADEILEAAQNCGATRVKEIREAIYGRIRELEG